MPAILRRTAQPPARAECGRHPFFDRHSVVAESAPIDDDLQGSTPTQPTEPVETARGRSPWRREGRVLVALQLLVLLAFVRIIWPFVGTLFWSVVLAVLFHPLQQRVLGLTGPARSTLATMVTLGALLFTVGLPMTLIAAVMVHQGSLFYGALASGQIDLGDHVARIAAALPPWVFRSLDRLGLGDTSTIQARLRETAVDISQLVAARLFSFSIDSFTFLVSVGVMVYLLFFLLRDGTRLLERLGRAVPLRAGDTAIMFATFVTVVRATVRGGAVMALLQGVLGGIVLALLGTPNPLFWGIVFGLCSILPAIGAGVLWVPLAAFLLVTGELAKAIALVFFGAVVLTVLDNLLRPLLVGRASQLPGYLVLISTLGGVAGFGFNGVVIGPVVAALMLAAWQLRLGGDVPAASGR